MRRRSPLATRAPPEPGIMEASPSSPRARWLGFALYFAAMGLLLPPTVHWDGLGFLAWSCDPLHLDYGHLLYVPLLRLSRELLAPVCADAVLAAQLLSVFGAALSFTLLWARLERGASTRVALIVALLVTSTPLFWNQASTVEPATLTIAALLLAANSAERYGRTRTALDAGLLGAASLLLLGLHLVSVFALPWLVFLARGPAPRPPVRHLLVPLGFLSGGVLCVLLSGRGGAFLRFPAYWHAFLPRFELGAVLNHAQRGATLAMAPGEGWPVLALVGLGALVLVLRSRAARAAALGTLGLAGPYLIAYVAFGKPLVPLLLPVTLALGMLLVQAASARPTGARPTGARPTGARPTGARRTGARRTGARRTGGLYLGLALGVQLWAGAALAFERRGQPDDRRVQAELLATVLPAGATMIVGPIGHHQTWYTEAPAVVLPDEIHAAGVREPADVLAFVTGLVEREAATHDQIFITSEAIEYLDWRWQTDGLDLALDPARQIEVRAEPELTLLPFVLAAN